MQKLIWYNEPNDWKFVGPMWLEMNVTPKTDFWRKTHYGFTIDNGPFYYCSVGGEFEASVNITGEYKSRFDQMGLMIRKNEKTWIKTGVEFVNNSMNISAVVTNKNSDWSMQELKEKPNSIWIKVMRRLNAVKIEYSLDGGTFNMLRLAPFPANSPVKLGLYGASPDGQGFNAVFENFTIKYLADKRRSKWLEEN